MNILQVIPYFNQRRGGDVNSCYNISKLLNKNGHKVTIITTSFEFDKNFAFNLSNLGIEVIPFKCIFNAQLFLFSPSMKKWLNENISFYDIIHLHSYRSYQNIQINHFAKKYNKPFIIQPHGSILNIVEKKGIKRLYDILWGYDVLKNTSNIIALSKMEAQQCKLMGVPDKKIVIIPNGIDLFEYNFLPSKESFKNKFNINNHKKIILYLGRIHKTKRIDLLIKAYAYLFQEMKYTDAVLVIAGPDAGYLSDVRSLASSLGISDSVLFTGFINNQEKLGALVDSDVFVTPSFYGFPITFLEACVTGTPIITTNIGDTLEWIDGQVGYVTLPIPSQIANAIIRILEDDDLHEYLSINCKEIIKDSYSLNHIVDMIEIMYKLIIKNQFE